MSDQVSSLHSNRDLGGTRGTGRIFARLFDRVPLCLPISHARLQPAPLTTHSTPSRHRSLH